MSMLTLLLLQALESFVLRSPHEVRPHLDTILATTLKYLSYDPNYADDMDADEDGDEDEDEADDECVLGNSGLLGLWTAAHKRLAIALMCEVAMREPPLMPPGSAVKTTAMMTTRAGRSGARLPRL